MDIRDETAAEAASDEAELARFGYKQELKRSLGLFSSFAVAFSYISPSTGIFTLFALGLTTIGGVFIWSWPIVALGQLCIALGFAELSARHFGAHHSTRIISADESLAMLPRLVRAFD